MTLDMTALEAKINKMNEEIAALRAKYTEDAKVMFSDACSSFFDSTPEIKSLQWTQYTPYFNDGEECIFSVNDIYYNINRNFGKTEEEIEEDGDEEDYDNWEGDQFSYRSTVELKAAIAEIERALAAPEHGWTVADFQHTYIWYLFDRSVFNVGKASGQLESLKTQLVQAEEENIRYPNRDQAIANFENFKKFFSKLDEDMLKDAFGDHVQIFVSRKGVDIQDYEHD